MKENDKMKSLEVKRQVLEIKQRVRAAWDFWSFGDILAFLGSFLVLMLRGWGFWYVVESVPSSSSLLQQPWVSYIYERQLSRGYFRY